MKLIKFFAVIIVGLIITNVTLTNHAVDQAVVVSELSSQIAELDHANTLLKAEIAQAGSLTKLTEKIEAAGYLPNPKTVALPALSSVASR